MSTILIQEPIVKQRTEPKLPKIINKDLTVLPWDWELPSTILMSKWASQHSQCKGVGARGTIEADGSVTDKSFCAMGLLAHYYGWNGTDKIDTAHMENLMPVLHRHSQNIVLMNDEFGCHFGSIGAIVKTDGI